MKEISSYALTWLRSEPVIDLDTDGAVSVAELLDAFEQYTPLELNLDVLMKALKRSSAFELLDSGQRVRARSGHLQDVVVYPRAAPSHPLYMACTRSQWAYLQDQGIEEGPGYFELYESSEDALKAKRAQGAHVFRLDAHEGDPECFFFAERWYITSCTPDAMVHLGFMTR